MFSDLIKSTKTPTKTKTDADKKAADARVEELLAQLFKKGEGAEMESEEEGAEMEGAEMDKGGAMAWRRKLTERAKSLVSPTEEEANGEVVKACGDGYKGDMKKAEDEEPREEEDNMSEDTDREEEPRQEEEGAEEEGAEDMSREAMLERVEAMLEGLSDEELSDFLSSREVKKALAQSVFSAMTAAQLAEVMSPEQANGATLAEPIEG